MMDESGGGTQIPLTFSKYEQVDFDLFEAGENQSALQHLKNIPNGDDKLNVYLWANPSLAFK